MSTFIKTSIVDVPKKAGEIDLFGIDKYKNGLIRFIENSDTPITIAIQGEWGSGKTSLMNSLQDNLCGGYLTSGQLKEHSHNFYGVWINTWQYSLMKSETDTLVSIVTGLSTKILEIINVRHKSSVQKLGSAVFNFGSKIIKKAATIAADKTIGEGAGEAIDSILEKESEQQTIKHLREELQIAINDCLDNDRKIGKEKKGFIFFIDDLDRIDPAIAVQILELLKNIFDLNNCIFVLAIDYDVVVKGLKPKFGELTDKNEREFRSFFDKIIQMPFSMPVASYKIDDFLIESLSKIRFLNEFQKKDTALSEKISMICNLSVGNNPRSLKRLMNTISLITIINEENDVNTSDEKIDNASLLINFALICIQISYPLIYKCLCIESDYKSWNEDLANKLKLRNLDQNEIEKLKLSEEFDELWEQILFRICEKDTYLSNRASQISQLLNLISTYITDGANLGEVIEEILELSAVTDIQAFDKPQQAINKGVVLKSVGDALIPLLKKQLPSFFPDVRKQSKKVQSNYYISYSKPKDGWKDWVGLTVNNNKENLSFVIWSHPWLLKTRSNDMRKDLKELGLLETFENIGKAYNEMLGRFPKFTMRFPGISSSGIANKKWHVPHLTFLYNFNNPQELSELVALNDIANFITEHMKLYAQLMELSELYNEKYKSL
jgi:hypothetical protein